MSRDKLGPLFPFIVSIFYLLLFTSVMRVFNTFLFFDHINQASQLWLIFLNGIRIDLVTATYLFAIPILIFITIDTFFNKSFSKSVAKIFTYWTVAAFLIIYFMEAITPLYIWEYGTRPERKFFEYLEHPKEVFNMLSGSYGFTGIVIISLLMLATPFLFNVIKKVFGNTYSWSRTAYFIFLPLVILVLVMCGRSSLDHRPINPSMVAFSDDVLLNNLPMNSLYSVLYAVYRLKDEEDASEIYGSLSDAEINHYIYEDRPLTPHINDNPTVDQINMGNKKNVVIILEESLGARFVERLGGTPLTPNLNNLADEGWWFTHLYATGTRSVRGIEAVVTGFLPTPGRSVVKLSSSQSKFFTLASLLKQHGYLSRFYYGGNAHFDNMKGFVLGNGFNEVIDQKEYTNPRYEGSWGVSDEDVFNRIHQDLSSFKQDPQFLVMLSTSNHTPFDFPVAPTDNYSTPLKSRDNAIRYADKAMGEFINNAKNSEYWNNTIFLIVADHDLRVADFTTAVDATDKGKTNKIFPVEGFHIPGLILGRGITPKVTNSIVSQIDLPVTLLSLIGIHGNHPMLGVDLTQIDNAYTGRAIMQFNDYQAYLEGQNLVVLRPLLEPLKGHYANGVFTQMAVENELEKKALAHALWASKSYKQQAYN